MLRALRCSWMCHRFQCGRGCRHSRWCGFGRWPRAKRGSRGLGRVSLACRTFGTRAWKTHVSSRGTPRAKFQQCWGGCYGWCGHREPSNLVSLSKHRHSCTKIWPCEWGQSLKCRGLDASCRVLNVFLRSWKIDDSLGTLAQRSANWTICPACCRCRNSMAQLWPWLWRPYSECRSAPQQTQLFKGSSRSHATL